jgi:hypothetical protein
VYPRVEKRKKNTRRDTQAAVGKFLLVLLLVVTMVPLPGIVRGQEGTPAAELPAAPAEVQAVPTDPPPPPTAIPTLPPSLPTAIPPTALPPTEVPPTAVPTPEPTATTAPTPTPEPSITYQAAPQPICELAPDEPTTVAHGDSIDYLCTYSVATTSSDVAPSSITATWSLDATVGGGWTVAMLPPVNDPALETPEWTVPRAETSFDFTQLEPVGVSDELTALDATARITFRVRIQRAVCSTVAVDVRLDHRVTVASPGATIVERETAGTQPRIITPSLEPIPEPSIAFDGPLTFGDVGVDASGVQDRVRSGFVSLTVSGLDDACGSYSLNVGASPMTDASGEVLDGAQMMLTSVNDQPVTGETCDLFAGCDAIVLVAAPDALPTQTVRLGVELRMPEHLGVGSWGTSLSASLLGP